MAGRILRTTCGINKTCPEIELTEEGHVKITGYPVGAAWTPENEVAVLQPARLWPGLADLHIELDQFDTWLEHHMGAPGDMLRIQTLQRYGNEDALVDAYHRGERAPVEDWAAWGQELDGYALADQTYRNLHIIDGELSREMVMQFGWAYRYNTDHGMDIRVLDVTDHPAARALLDLGDYWVIDHDHVLRCGYDTDGRPTGYVQVEPAGAAGYRTSAAMAWELGQDFTAWWAAHPQYHRTAARAA